MKVKSKVCIDCKQLKPLDDYYKQFLGKDGHRTECKKCHNKKTRKNTLKIPIEKRREYMRNYM